MPQIQYIKYLYLFLLFVAAFIERVFFDLGPNVELVTAALILSAFYIGKKESFWLTFAIIAISDLIIGNSNIFIFTWTGFLIPALFSSNLIKKLTPDSKHQNIINIFSAIPLTAVGTSANIFFFLWTNLGVWLIGDLYPKTAGGLLSSYINGLPFLKNQIMSSLLFIPLGFIITKLFISLNEKYHLIYKLAVLLHEKNKIIS